MKKELVEGLCSVKRITRKGLTWSLDRFCRIFFTGWTILFLLFSFLGGVAYLIVSLEIERKASNEAYYAQRAKMSKKCGLDVTVRNIVRLKEGGKAVGGFNTSRVVHTLYFSWTDYAMKCRVDNGYFANPRYSEVYFHLDELDFSGYDLEDK